MASGATEPTRFTDGARATGRNMKQPVSAIKTRSRHGCVAVFPPPPGHHQKHDASERHSRVNERVGDPFDGAAMPSKIVFEHPPIVYRRCRIITQGVNDDAVPPCSQSCGRNEVDVECCKCNRRESRKHGALTRDHNCGLLAQARLPRKENAECHQHCCTFRLRETSGQATECTGRRHPPSRRSSQQHEHRSERDHGAEPVVSCIGRYRQDQSDQKQSGHDRRSPGQDSKRDSRHQKDCSRREKRHGNVRDPKVQTKFPDHEGINQICPGRDDLEIIAVG